MEFTIGHKPSTGYWYVQHKGKVVSKHFSRFTAKRAVKRYNRLIRNGVSLYV